MASLAYTARDWNFGDLVLVPTGRIARVVHVLADGRVDLAYVGRNCARRGVHVEATDVTLPAKLLRPVPRELLKSELAHG